MRYADVCDGKLRVYENGAVFRLVDGTECTPTITNTAGYASVRLPDKNHLVHRLVAEAFIPNPENKPQVNHRDGNKRNNSVGNLEWVTRKENMEHAGRMGLIGKEKRNANRGDPQLGRQTVLNIKLLCLRKGITVAELERETKLSNGTISKWTVCSPKVNSLQRIADYFGVSLDDLLKEED